MKRDIYQKVLDSICISVLVFLFQFDVVSKSDNRPTTLLTWKGGKKMPVTEVQTALDDSFVSEVPRKKKRRQKILKLRGEVADCGVSEN